MIKWAARGEKLTAVIYNNITWAMCSAAATLGLTISQFAITSVFGTLPSVQVQKNENKTRGIIKIPQTEYEESCAMKKTRDTFI